MIKEIELYTAITCVLYWTSVHHRFKELDEDRKGKKQHQAQEKELEKMARENEEQKERLRSQYNGGYGPQSLTITDRSVS